MNARALSRTLVVALALSPFAAAQPSPFEEHLRRGVALRRDGRDVESIAEFEAAHRLSPEPRAAAQLGLACQAVGRWLDADRLLREALDAREDPWVARNRSALDRALAVVAGHVGTLEVHGDVDGAEVRVDGALVATLPMRAPATVLAGLVTLDVTAPGHVPVSRRFSLEPGALARETVTLRPIAPEPATTPDAAVATDASATSPDAGETSRTADASVVSITPATLVAPPTPRDVAEPRSTARLVWAVAAWTSGALTLGFGGVALGLREDTAARYNRHAPACPPPPAVTGTDCGELEAAESTWRTAAWVALPLGVALVTTGALLLFLPTRRASHAAVRCAPDVSGVGLSCAGWF